MAPSSQELEPPGNPVRFSGARPARDGLDRDRLARGHERRACLALCPDPGARRARRHPAECAARGGMAADRVAEGEPEPTQYWLSTLPEEIGFEQMVDLAQLRWRIERDYQDLKQEVGL